MKSAGRGQTQLPEREIPLVVVANHQDTDLNIITLRHMTSISNTEQRIPGSGDELPLLSLGAVAGLGGLLGGAPPGLVLHVPVDGLAQSLGEVGALGAPAELTPQLRGVDRVAAVVAGAVAHPVEVLGIAAHGLQDHPEDRDVVPLPVGADEVGLAHAAPREDVPDGAGVVLGVDPVADVLAGAVELRPDTVDDVCDLARDELLHVLVGAVVVGTVGDGGPEPVCAGPRAHDVCRSWPWWSCRGWTGGRGSPR